MATIGFSWTLVILLVIQVCNGLDNISQQLLDRINRLEKQGEVQAVAQKRLEHEFQDFQTKTKAQNNAYEVTIHYLQQELTHAQNVIDKLENKLAHLEENFDNTNEYNAASENLPHLEENFGDNDVPTHKLAHPDGIDNDKNDSNANDPVSKTNNKEKKQEKKIKVKTDAHKYKTDKNDLSTEPINSKSNSAHKLIQAQWLNKHKKTHEDFNKNNESDHSNSDNKHKQEDSEKKQSNHPNKSDENEPSNTKPNHKHNSNTKHKSTKAKSDKKDHKIKRDTTNPSDNTILEKSNTKQNQAQADSPKKHHKYLGQIGNSNSLVAKSDHPNKKQKNHHSMQNSNGHKELPADDTRKEHKSKESTAKNTHKIGNSNTPKKTYSNGKLDTNQAVQIESNTQNSHLHGVTKQSNSNKNEQPTGNSNQKHQGEVNRERRLDPLPVPTPVAFHALLEGNEHKHLGHNQIIKYNNTIYNKGEGYDAVEGVFRAPRPGIYIFSASLTSAANEYSTFWAELTKEDTPLARINIYGHRGVADQSSVTAVTHLELGQQVWVRIIEGSDISIWGDKYSYFTGTLLHAD